MKKSLLLILSVILNLAGFSQTTAIPDVNFEQALIDLGYDNTIDGGVLTDNISGITTLDVSNKSISDLTGIEGFIGLTKLNCYYNQLTFLNVTQNINLTILGCHTNQLTSLNITQNINLTNLYCYSNLLTSLDLSNSIALEEVACFVNQLTSLDLSNSIALNELECSNNNLSCLNVKNGNNKNLNLFAALNSNLACIEVDDAAYSTNNWFNIGSQTSFSEDCEFTCASLQQVENTQNLFTLYPNPTSEILTIELNQLTNTGFAISDQLGNIVRESVVSSQKQVIDVSTLPKGIYVISVGEVNQRFIKD